MKLLYETTNEVVTEQEINESTNSKKYVIKGIFSSPGIKNKNGRVYPKNIWEKEVEKYQEVIKSGSSNSLLELDHPPRTNVDMMEAVAKMRKLWIDGEYVMGEAVLLDNTKANQLKTLIDHGIKMAVSSRGVGKVNNGLVEDFKLVTFDVIPNQSQSDINAQMMGITEGVLTEKEFDITEDGKIEEVKVCSSDKEGNESCCMFKPEEIQEATVKKFNEILSSISGKDLTEKQVKEIVTDKIDINERMKIDKKALCKELDKLDDNQLAKVVAFVFQLQD